MDKKQPVSAFISGAVFAFTFVAAKRFAEGIFFKTQEKEGIFSKSRKTKGMFSKNRELEDMFFQNTKVKDEENTVEKQTARVLRKGSTRDHRAQKQDFEDFTLSLDYPDISIPEVTPIIRNDRTMLPMHALAAALGLNALWNDYSQTATLQNRDISIVMTLGSNIARVNGHDVCVDAPAIAWKDVIFLPVRFIAEEMGCKVMWSEDSRKVIVKSE